MTTMEKIVTYIRHLGVGSLVVQWEGVAKGSLWTSKTARPQVYGTSEREGEGTRGDDG